MVATGYDASGYMDDVEIVNLEPGLGILLWRLVS